MAGLRTSRLWRSHAPVAAGGADAWRRFRPCVRIDFAFQCAYCGAHEREVRPAGARMHLDHHRPRAVFPEYANRYENLYLACPECNEAKGACWPTEQEQAAGRRFLDVCAEAASDHLKPAGALVHARGGSPIGRFTIAMLDLNGPAHRERRRIAAEAREELRRVKRMLRDVLRLPAGSSARARFQRELELMRRRCEEILDVREPLDAPSGCACGGSSSFG